jgi:hypothetical protein
VIASAFRVLRIGVAGGNSRSLVQLLGYNMERVGISLSVPANGLGIISVFAAVDSKSMGTHGGIVRRRTPQETTGINHNFAKRQGYDLSNISPRSGQFVPAIQVDVSLIQDTSQRAYRTLLLVGTIAVVHRLTHSANEFYVATLLTRLSKSCRLKPTLDLAE